MISSWVHTSDENAALQFLPNAGAPGNGNLYNVPSLYVGNSTGELIRKMVSNGEVKTATIVLDAPSYEAPTKTVIGYLPGLAGRDESLLLYTHSEYTMSSFCFLFLKKSICTGDGPSIIEENGVYSHYPVLY